VRTALAWEAEDAVDVRLRVVGMKERGKACRKY